MWMYDCTRSRRKPGGRKPDRARGQGKWGVSIRKSTCRTVFLPQTSHVTSCSTDICPRQPHPCASPGSVFARMTSRGTRWRSRHASTGRNSMCSDVVHHRAQVHMQGAQETARMARTAPRAASTLILAALHAHFLLADASSVMARRARWGLLQTDATQTVSSLPCSPSAPPRRSLKAATPTTQPCASAQDKRTRVGDGIQSTNSWLLPFRKSGRQCGLFLRKNMPSSNSILLNQ